MTYSINFSTNAAQAIRDIEQISRSIGDLGRLGNNIPLTLNTTGINTALGSTFRKLDKEISKLQRKLAKTEIGSGDFLTRASRLGTTEGRRQRGQMMADAPRLRSQGMAFDEGSSVRLSKELQAAQIDASQIAPNTAPWIELQQQIGRINVQLRQSDQLAESVQMRESLGAFAPGSLARLETRLTILKNSARGIAPDTNTWQRLNKEIQKTERSIQRINKKPLSSGQRVGAAGGAFL